MNLFGRLIGHEAVKRRLSAQLERQTIPHAVLFHGPRHVGKGTAAGLFAAALLGTERPASHPDFRMLGRVHDPKSGRLKKRIGIEAIRELRIHLQMTGFLGGRKVVIVDEAELLSEEAANGLLKTLEEPSKGSVIILISHDITRVLPTVRSRAALFGFARVPDVTLEEALRGQQLSEAEVQRLSRFSAGRPGIALGLKSDPDMLHWYQEQELRWQALRQGPLHRRFSSLESLAPPRADREETVRRITDAVGFWEILLQRELRRGSKDAARLLAGLAELRADLDVNVAPRLLLERFALTMDAPAA